MARDTALRILFSGLLTLLLVTPTTAEAPKDTIHNDFGMKFVLIKPGSFTMGSPANEPYRGAGETQHLVTLTKPFYMQTTEITIAQWRRIMGKGMRRRFNRSQKPDRMPVTRIGWHDVQSFIKKLNAHGNARYRLPTEAEWEYAARAGTKTIYSWGDRIDCSNAMFSNNKHKFDMCRNHALSNTLPVDGPAPVMSYPPNTWGLYDMHGNVWEWCQDWFAPYPHKTMMDPGGPSRGTQRVRRGGSWFSSGYTCRSANRAHGHPASRLHTTGFRLVREVAP